MLARNFADWLHVSIFVSVIPEVHHRHQTPALRSVTRKTHFAFCVFFGFGFGLDFPDLRGGASTSDSLSSSIASSSSTSSSSSPSSSDSTAAAATCFDTFLTCFRGASAFAGGAAAAAATGAVTGFFALAALRSADLCKAIYAKSMLQTVISSNTKGTGDACEEQSCPGAVPKQSSC